MTTRKVKLFKKRSLRVRNKLKKTGYGKCRLSIHRSSKNMYAQVIDDRLGTTLASVSSPARVVRSIKVTARSSQPACHSICDVCVAD